MKLRPEEILRGRKLNMKAHDFTKGDYSGNCLNYCFHIKDRYWTIRYIVLLYFDQHTTTQHVQICK